MTEPRVVSPFPVLDWPSLEKGTVLGAIACAEAMGVSVAKWRSDRLLMLHLVRAIREHRPDLSAHVRCAGDTVQILDDPEACTHTWTRAVQHARGIAVQAARRASIDRYLLSADQRRLAEARDSALTRAAIAARREIRAEVPQLERGEKEDGGG